MDFTYRIESDTDLDANIHGVTAALAEQGFGIPTRIDLQDILKITLDVDTDPQVGRPSVPVTLRLGA